MTSAIFSQPPEPDKRTMKRIFILLAFLLASITQGVVAEAQTVGERRAVKKLGATTMEMTMRLQQDEVRFFRSIKAPAGDEAKPASTKETFSLAIKREDVNELNQLLATYEEWTETAKLLNSENFEKPLGKVGQHEYRFKWSDIDGGPKRAIIYPLSDFTGFDSALIRELLQQLPQVEAELQSKMVGGTARSALFPGKSAPPLR